MGSLLTGRKRLSASPPEADRRRREFGEAEELGIIFQNLLSLIAVSQSLDGALDPYEMGVPFFCGSFDRSYDFLYFSSKRNHF
jgi:hypothetical protein